MAAFVNAVPVVRANFSAPRLSTKQFFGVRAAPAVSAKRCNLRMVNLPVFKEAMEDYKNDYPEFAKRGWGATVKAERWNGRHAMFGLLTLVITAYCKGHGLIPEPDKILDISVWGPLARLGDGVGITNERAIILVAHIHVLLVSVCAAIAPFSFQDKLLLEPGEEDEEPAGLFPPLTFGLTKDAELWNSRVAMLGVCSIVGISVATSTPILDVINIGLGKILY